MTPELAWVARRTDGGEDWLASLPGLVAALAERWHLALGPSYTPGGLNSWVAPATRLDGSPAVLKVTIPHEEARYEVDALLAWDGRGAVRVLEHHRPAWACLLERCDPGDALRDAYLPDDEAADVLIDVLAELWRAPAAGPFIEVADEMARQATATRELADKFPVLLLPRLTGRAAETFERSTEPGGRRVLLHRDLHAGNLLRSRRGWLAIDPKPSIGPAWCDLGQALANGLPTRLQVGRMTRALDLDRTIVADYALATCVLMALWNANLGRHQAARELAARALELA